LPLHVSAVVLNEWFVLTQAFLFIAWCGAQKETWRWAAVTAAGVQVKKWIVDNADLLPHLFLKRVITEWNPYSGGRFLVPTYGPLYILAAFGFSGILNMLFTDWPPEYMSLL
jgi:hypothetical protein